MKLFTAENIKLIDELTIKIEQIASIDLMERAATIFFTKFCELFDNSHPIYVFCGPGNNGGDGLAIARMLLQSDYDVKVFLIYRDLLSLDCQLNEDDFLKLFPDKLFKYSTDFVPPIISSTESVIIDGLFGSGLSRSLSGLFFEVAQWINNSGYKVVSIDIPSGMFSEQNILENQYVVNSNHTLTFHFPKLSFFLPEVGNSVGKWQILDIGLDINVINEINTNYFYIDKSLILNKYRRRNRFSHKGTYGHALLIAGSKGMSGSAILSSKAALRSGVGLLTLHSTECNRLICQSSVSELIYSTDKNNDFIVSFPDLKNFTTIGVGCGIGTYSETASMLEKLFSELFSPCIIDADALNIISRNKHFFDLIPENSILTPHPKEFDRLFGFHNSTWSRIQKAREMSIRYKVIIILKGAYTVVIHVDGSCYFNSTGNSGMSTAGSGDVLTGILTSLLSQGYLPLDAALFGVYMHGLAADIALSCQSEESLIASDIIENIGNAFKSLN